MAMMKEISIAYEEWLMENYPDEIQTKEDLIKLTEEGRHWEEFCMTIQKVLK